MNNINTTSPDKTNSDFDNWKSLHIIFKTGENIDALSRWGITHPCSEYSAEYQKMLHNLKCGYIPMILKGDTPESQTKCYFLQKTFLNILTFELQLDTLEWINERNDQTMTDFYSLLKFDCHSIEDQKLVKQHSLFSKTFSELFYQENFDMIDNLEKIFNYPFLEKSFDHAHWIYPHKPFPKINLGEQLTWNLTKWGIEDAIFQPFHEIIYCYSANKETYLNARGLTIPNQDTVNQYRQFFENIYQRKPKAIPPDYWNKLHNGLNNYEKVLQYYELNNNLPLIESQDDSSSLKKLKI